MPISEADCFEPNQVSSSVSAAESVQFLEDHGFFYQEIAMIGEKVDELYRRRRVRSKDATLDHFKPVLRDDERLRNILDHYAHLPLFSLPWGTTPVYYNWARKESLGADTGLVAYLLGSKSQLVGRDGSHGIDFDGEQKEGYGTLEIPSELLEDYPKMEVRMEKGGVLLVRPRHVHRPTRGRSIVYGLQARTRDGGQT